ncbi:hypothetical protein GCM10023079_54750 [Streptomyces chitinivorans]
MNFTGAGVGDALEAEALGEGLAESSPPESEEQPATSSMGTAAQARVRTAVRVALRCMVPSLPDVLGAGHALSDGTTVRQLGR